MVIPGFAADTQNDSSYNNVADLILQALGQARSAAANRNHVSHHYKATKIKKIAII